MKKIYVWTGRFSYCGPPWNWTDLDGGGTSLSLSMSMMIKKCASVEWEYDAKQNLTCKLKHKQIIESQVCCWFQGLNWDSQWLEIAAVAGKGFCWDVPWLSMSSNVGSATCHIPQVEAPNPKSWASLVESNSCDWKIHRHIYIHRNQRFNTEAPAWKL